MLTKLLTKVAKRYRFYRYVHYAKDISVHDFNYDELQNEGYFSQCGQDKWISEVLLPNIKKGIFVDVGAHDGISFSNTYYLEKKGWSGLAIEPNPTIFEKLRHNRQCQPVNACISSVSGNAQFRLIDGYSEMLSGLVEKYDPRHEERIQKELAQHGGSFSHIQVQCLRLDEILENNDIAHIDYLSIDVEGGEIGVLNSIDFKKVKVSVIGIENNYGDYRIPKILSSNGFRFHSKVGDEFYVSKSLEHNQSQT